MQISLSLLVQGSQEILNTAVHNYISFEAKSACEISVPGKWSKLVNKKPNKTNKQQTPKFFACALLVVYCDILFPIQGFPAKLLRFEGGVGNTAYWNCEKVILLQVHEDADLTICSAYALVYAIRSLCRTKYVCVLMCCRYVKGRSPFLPIPCSFHIFELMWGQLLKLSVLACLSSPLFSSAFNRSARFPFLNNWRGQDQSIISFCLPFPQFFFSCWNLPITFEAYIGLFCSTGDIIKALNPLMREMCAAWRLLQY